MEFKKIDYFKEWHIIYWKEFLEKYKYLVDNNKIEYNDIKNIISDNKIKMIKEVELQLRELNV